VAQNDVKIRVGAQDKASQKLKQVNKNLGTIDKSTKNYMAGLAKAGATIAATIYALDRLARVLGELQRAYFEQERAVTQLESALKSTGYAVGITAREMQNFAATMSRMTAIADEDIIRAQALMVTFTQIGREVFPDALRAAADMSVMFGQDLQQSVIQLGTALNDPIQGVGRLRRIGISFTQDQRDLIANFVEMNDIASAQAVILNELAVEFGGVAEAMGETAEAINTRLINAFGDLKEALGWAFTGDTALGNLVNHLKELATSIFNWGAESIQMNRLGKELNETFQALNAEIEAGVEFGIDRYPQFTELLEDVATLIATQPEEAARTWIPWRDWLIDMVNYLEPLYEAEQKRLEQQEEQAERQQEIADAVNTSVEAWQAELELMKLIHGEEVDVEKYALKAAEELIKLGLTAKEVAPIIAKAFDIFWMKPIELTVPPSLKSLLEGGGPGAIALGYQPGAPTFAPPSREPEGARFQDLLMSAVMPFIDSITAVLDVMQPLQIVLFGFMQVMKPLIDTALRPLMGVLVIVGRLLGATLAPIIQALIPIIERLAEGFVWFYNNAILPVANVIISIFNIAKIVVYGFINALIEFMNLFRRAGKEKPLLPMPTDIREGHLEKIDLADILEAGGEYAAATGGAGGIGSTTTVQRAPEIRVYNYFNGPVWGEGGPAEVGKDIAYALREYLDIGGTLVFLEG